MALSPATADFFTSFCPSMLAFLFLIVHCGISEYQGGVEKVVKPFNRKIIQSMYFDLRQ